MLLIAGIVIAIGLIIATVLLWLALQQARQELAAACEVMREAAAGIAEAGERVVEIADTLLEIVEGRAGR